MPHCEETDAANINPGRVRRPSGFIEPCLPTSSHTVPAGPQWIYQVKQDPFFPYRGSKPGTNLINSICLQGRLRFLE